ADDGDGPAGGGADPPGEALRAQLLAVEEALAGVVEHLPGSTVVHLHHKTVHGRLPAGCTLRVGELWHADPEVAGMKRSEAVRPAHGGAGAVCRARIAYHRAVVPVC